MENSEYFKVETDKGIARCTMHGPNMNAMGVELVFPMIEALKSIFQDDTVRVIVIRGEGGNFSSGADLSILGANADPLFLSENMTLVNSVINELHEGPKPYIAEVDGWVAGAGFSMAVASDITYATERARFYMSFIRISVIPDLGSAYLLTKRVGLSIAKELALTGKIIDAEEALRIGLINKIVSHEDISEEVMKLARRIADRPPKVISLTKRLLNIGHQVSLQTLLDIEAHAQPIMILAPEHKRDVEDFFKK
jgi:2-(1,2-epoxy-1,2-dihydrophenyl)acetyl-CoA isomerase